MHTNQITTWKRPLIEQAAIIVFRKVPNNEFAFAILYLEIILLLCCTPGLGKLIFENKILAYNVPMGAVTQLYRDVAAGKPGNLTHVGLGTFIDPRVDGGKLNELTKTEGDDLITLMNVDGKDYLFYRAFPIS